MENNNSLEAFNSMPVSKAVIKNAIPAMIAMLMVLIYNLADTFFIGQTHDAYQVAAVSLATPVFLMFMAVGTVFGIGGTSVISRALGEGRKEYAKKVCSFCMWSCVIVGIAMSLVFLIFMDQILSLIGASSDTWDFARSYLIIVSLSGPFVLISNCYSNILRAEGQANKAMMGQLIGNFLNIILDPIMILGFGWNIKGAAIATVIGNLAAAYYILYFIRGKSSLSININDFSIKDKICSGVLIIGIQPLLGYCVGANTWDRFKKIMKFSLIFSFLLGLILTVLCYLFTNSIVSAFLTEPSAFDYSVQFSRILLTTSTFFGVFYVLTNALQAMGAAVSSLIINLSRQGLIYIPALFILREALGITGLAWLQPVADILSILIAIVLYLWVSKKMMKLEEDKEYKEYKINSN